MRVVPRGMTISEEDGTSYPVGSVVALNGMIAISESNLTLIDEYLPSRGMSSYSSDSEGVQRIGSGESLPGYILDSKFDVGTVNWKDGYEIRKEFARPNISQLLYRR